MHTYSDPSRASDPYALPDVEVFQLTANEVAESSAYEDEQWEYLHRPFREIGAPNMNSRDRETMLDAMIAEIGITGGWYYWYCFPGCMPDSDPIGPFATEAEALAAAQEDAQD